MLLTKKLRLLTAVACAGAFAALPAAEASADLVEVSACDDAALSQPFKRWGDLANYKLVPGGDAEGALDGWSLAGGARKVAGSEGYGVTGAVGSSSFSIPAGGSITTPATCVNAGAPTYRFFSRSSGGLLGLVPAMKVELLYRDSALRVVALPLGTALPSSSWQPSLPLATGSVLAGVLNNGEAPLALRFTAISGTWQIDDVFVDPYRRV